jgi:CRP-like cAMP-binding protein
VLAAHGWLARTPDAFRDAVLSHTIWRTAEPGDVIANAGDDIGGLIGFVEGAFAVASPDRLEAPLIHLFHPGDWTGLVPLVAGRARRATTIARTSGCYALVTQADMQRLLARNPESWREIARLSDELTEIALLAATNLMIPDSARRIAGVLLRLAGYRPPAWPSVRGDIPVSHDELAVISAMSRNTLAKVLHQFEAEGLVQVSYRRIAIRDTKGLADRAGD